LRGRAVMHTANILDEETGQPVLTRTLGQRLGTEQVTLTADQMPSHAHALSGGGSTGMAGGSPASHDTTQPSIALNYIIALGGVLPQEGSPGDGNESDLTFLGEVALFAGDFAPRGWGFAQGQLLSISQNQALYQILGTTFGGNGQTTFALPDLRAALPVHAGGSAGPGLTQVLLGQEFGAQHVTLTEAELGPHAHDVVPEPGGVALLALGVVSLAARRARLPGRRK
jgi:microcystin-dependent protein